MRKSAAYQTFNRVTPLYVSSLQSGRWEYTYVIVTCNGYHYMLSFVSIIYVNIHPFSAFNLWIMLTICTYMYICIYTFFILFFLAPMHLFGPWTPLLSLPLPRHLMIWNISIEINLSFLLSLSSASEVTPAWKRFRHKKIKGRWNIFIFFTLLEHKVIQW